MSGAGSLANVLIQEYTAISNETKRKHPELKQEIDAAIQVLSSSGNIQDWKDSSEVLLKPLIDIITIRQPVQKLIQSSVLCLQKIISHRIFSENYVPMVQSLLTELIALTGLQIGSSSAVTTSAAFSGAICAEIQLKVLQILLPLLSNYRTVHGEVLGEMFVLCFRLLESKSSVVQNTAAATLRQMVIQVFEKMKQEDLTLETVASPEEGLAKGALERQDDAFVKRYVSIIPSISSLSACALDAYLLFLDFCLLINSESPIFLRLEYMNKTFGLELIESILSNHYKLFIDHHEFMELTKGRVVLVLVKSVSDANKGLPSSGQLHGGEFPLAVRLMRVIYIVIRYFAAFLKNECEIFLSMFTEILESSLSSSKAGSASPSKISAVNSSYWQHCLCMEVLKDILVDTELFLILYESGMGDDDKNDVLDELLRTLHRVAQQKISAIQQNDYIGLMNSNAKIQCMDLLDKIEPPQELPQNYLLFLILNTFIGISENLSEVVLSDQLEFVFEDSGLLTSEKYPVKNPVLTTVGRNTFVKRTENKLNPLVEKLIKVSVARIFDCLEMFLGSQIELELFHVLLRSYQNFLITANVVLPDKWTWMINFCKFVFINKSNTPLIEKITICKRVLLNILYARSESFSAKFWFLLVNVLYSNNPTGLDSNLDSTLANLLESSKFWSDAALLECMNGLIEVNMQLLGISSVAKEFTDFQFFQLKQDGKSFALDKMRAVLLNNVKRIAESCSAAGIYGKLFDNSFKHLSFVILYPSTLITLKSQVIQILGEFVLSAIKINSPTISAEVIQKRLVLEPLHFVVKLENSLAALANAEEEGLSSYQDSLILKFGEPFQTGLQVSQVFLEVQKMMLDLLQKVLETGGELITQYGLIYQILIETISPNTSLPDNKASTSTYLQKYNSLSKLNLIRVSFPSLQLICSDFLQQLSFDDLLLCIKTAGLYAKQNEDLNVSITAVGLLWQISEVIVSSAKDSSASKKSEAAFELIRSLLSQLQALCIDSRHEIRNTCIQTLFRSISMTFFPLLSSKEKEIVLSEFGIKTINDLASNIEQIRRKEFNVHLIDCKNEDDLKQLLLYYEEYAASFKSDRSANTNSAAASLLKFYNESLIYCLNGLASISIEMLRVMNMENFSKILAIFVKQFTGVCTSSFENGMSMTYITQSEDVCISSIKNMKEIFKAVSADGSTLLDKLKCCLHAWLLTGILINKRKDLVVEYIINNVLSKTSFQGDLNQLFLLNEVINLNYNRWETLAHYLNLIREVLASNYLLILNDKKVLRVFYFILRRMLTYRAFNYLQVTSNEDSEFIRSDYFPADAKTNFMINAFLNPSEGNIKYCFEMRKDFNYNTSVNVKYAPTASLDMDQLSPLHELVLEILFGTSKFYEMKQKFEYPSSGYLVGSGEDKQLKPVVYDSFDYLVLLEEIRKCTEILISVSPSGLSSTSAYSSVLMSTESPSLMKQSVLEFLNLKQSFVESKRVNLLENSISTDNVMYGVNCNFYTFAAASRMLLEGYVDFVAKCYGSDYYNTVSMFLHTLSLLVSIKYNIIPKDVGFAILIWKDALQQVLRLMDICLKPDDSDSVKLSPSFTQVLKNVLECKNLPNSSSYLLENFNRDEEYLIVFVKTFCLKLLNSFVDNHQHIKEDTSVVVNVFEMLLRNSRLYVEYQPDVVLLYNFQKTSAEGDLKQHISMLPSVYKNLNKTILMFLFEMLSGKLFVLKSASSFLIEALFPLFIKQVYSIIENYCDDLLDFGRLSFPVSRNEEVLLLLSLLSELEIDKNVDIAAILSRTTTLAESDTGSNDESLLFLSETHPELLHLFYLYPLFCKMIERVSPDNTANGAEFHTLLSKCLLKLGVFIKTVSINSQ